MKHYLALARVSPEEQAGLNIALRGNGMVIADASGTMVKASDGTQFFKRHSGKAARRFLKAAGRRSGYTGQNLQAETARPCQPAKNGI